MPDMTVRLEHLLDERVRPVVMDRGGDLEFSDYSAGVLKLKILGSPGATIPIRNNISTLIRHYVAEVRGVEFITGAGSVGVAASSFQDAVRQVVDEQINPSVVAHGGSVNLIEVTGDTVYIRFEGGCQGCAMAHVTLCQGVEVLIKDQVPGVIAVVDTTDHDRGTNPFFKTRKSRKPSGVDQ